MVAVLPRAAVRDIVSVVVGLVPEGGSVMRRSLAVVTVTCFVLGACAIAAGPAGAGTATRSGATRGTIAWATCTDPQLRSAGAECGLVEVPLDYADPGGAMIRIAVSRVRHRVPDSAYQGPVLVNPGGPGGPG